MFILDFFIHNAIIKRLPSQKNIHFMDLNYFGILCCQTNGFGVGIEFLMDIQILKTSHSLRKAMSSF